MANDAGGLLDTYRTSSNCRPIVLVASCAIGVLDRYRVPYEVDATISEGIVRIARAGRSGPQLLALEAPPDADSHTYLFGDTVIHVALAERSACAVAMSECGVSWVDEIPIVDLKGVRQASAHRGSDGSVFLPFGIDTPFDNLHREAYLDRGPAAAFYVFARAVYYRMRGLIPRRVQLTFRRSFRSYQERNPFPAWPIETSLHRLEAEFLGLVEQVGGEPLPWIAPWPSSYSWCLVLTHDVEHLTGYKYVDSLRAVEERHGLRSAWYFVPERDYVVEDPLLDRLRRGGCEIGVHGLHHDGRDMSPGVFEERLPAMRSYAEKWGARGFRGPATHRDRDLLQQLRVEHDSSWCDVARYEPQPGGSCSWLPFFVGDVVELPITLPMDHTIYEILDEAAYTVWLEKTAFLRDQGGMALMVTHPDYLLQPERLADYERFLASQTPDTTAWHALPHEVASWWRARAGTTLFRRNGGWVARGPAAESARVCFGAPQPPPRSLAYRPGPNTLVDRSPNG